MSVPRWAERERTSQWSGSLNKNVEMGGSSVESQPGRSGVCKTGVKQEAIADKALN